MARSIKPIFAEPYDEQYQMKVLPKLDEIEDLLLQGYNRKQCASFIGIPEQLFYSYIHKYPELMRIIDKARIAIALKAEDTLVKTAMGYEYMEKKKVVYKDASGEIYMTKEEESTRHKPADKDLLIKLLEHEFGEKWKSQKEEDIELDDELGGLIEDD